jgi:hypothetical protein
VNTGFIGGVMPSNDGGLDIIDQDFFSRLRRAVEREIAEYIYTIPVGAVGTPMSTKEIADDLALMRLCLVEPRWEDVEIRDTPEEVKMDVGPKRKCVTIAEDHGYVLMFDQIENSYVLAYRQDKGLVTFGIRGDAVECFLAR